MATVRRGRLGASAVAVFVALSLTGCVVDETGAGVPARSRAETQRQFAALDVAPAGSMRGYSRARFPHWRDTGVNCDVRDEVLRREGTRIRTRDCNVVGGRWTSPYDERVHTDPTEVDIDHVVPLANAWRSGAADWTDERRGEFANDLTRPQLLAVTRAVNRAKGDQDPSQWKPANRGYWCRYAQDWIAVKHHWKLTVTATEKTALTQMLKTCRWPTT